MGVGAHVEDARITSHTGDGIPAKKESDDDDDEECKGTDGHCGRPRGPSSSRLTFRSTKFSLCTTVPEGKAKQWKLELLAFDE